LTKLLRRLTVSKSSHYLAKEKIDDKITELALSDDEFPDFEFGLQYYSAIENGIDNIITRNKKDFKNSQIPVMTAKKFIAKKTRMANTSKLI
jgi:hypothetical protein